MPRKEALSEGLFYVRASRRKEGNPHLIALTTHDSAAIPHLTLMLAVRIIAPD